MQFTEGRRKRAMSYSFQITRRSAEIVGRTPWSARSDAFELILSKKKRVQGDPRGPGGPPHNFCRFSALGKLYDIGRKRLPYRDHLLRAVEPLDNNPALD